MSDSGYYRGGMYDMLKGGSGGKRASGPGMDTSGDRQYYRSGMYDMLKNGRSVLHGRSKAKKPKHGVTHHGRAGMHGDTLTRGASHDVWSNRDRMRGQR